MYLKRRAGAHESRFHWPLRCAIKIGGENFRDGLGVPRGLQQAGTPLRENRGNLIGIFFCDEIVEACLHLQQRGIERPVSSIMRVQMESDAGVRFALRW